MSEQDNQHDYCQEFEDIYDLSCIWSEETIKEGELPKPPRPLTYDNMTGDLTEESKEIIRKSNELKQKRLKEIMENE